jgi:hypothetical protein
MLSLTPTADRRRMPLGALLDANGNSGELGGPPPSPGGEGGGVMKKVSCGGKASTCTRSPPGA